jgi:hypothetical protein
MGRIYRINGKRKMTGAELVAFARREFKKDSKGLSRYARPTNVTKAAYYLKQRTSRNKGHRVEEKLESEKEWF